MPHGRLEHLNATSTSPPDNGGRIAAGGPDVLRPLGRAPRGGRDPSACASPSACGERRRLRAELARIAAARGTGRRRRGGAPSAEGVLARVPRLDRTTAPPRGRLGRRPERAALQFRVDPSPSRRSVSVRHTRRPSRISESLRRLGLGVTSGPSSAPASRSPDVHRRYGAAR
jgi:hypothetical protein